MQDYDMSSGNPALRKRGAVRQEVANVLHIVRQFRSRIWSSLKQYCDYVPPVFEAVSTSRMLRVFKTTRWSITLNNGRVVVRNSVDAHNALYLSYNTDIVKNQRIDCIHVLPSTIKSISVLPKPKKVYLKAIVSHSTRLWNAFMVVASIRTVYVIMHSVGYLCQQAQCDRPKMVTRGQ